MNDVNPSEHGAGAPVDPKRERNAAIARAAAGSVPVVGPVMLELFSWVILAPLGRRRDEWMQRVEKRLGRLEDLGADLGELADSDEFLTTVGQASQIAMRTHQEEKRGALQAAISNAALGSAPDDDVRLMFLRWVDELTVTHLQILQFLDRPGAYLADRGAEYRPAMSSSLAAALELAIPPLAGRRELYDLVGGELNARGLTNHGGFHTMMTAHGWDARRTTDLGRQFLAFITDPIDPSINDDHGGADG